MSIDFSQHLLADRIGGNTFGQDTKLYKFEKIKRAKRSAMKAHPEMELVDMGVGEPDDMAFPEVLDTLSQEAAKWENRTYTDNGISSFRKAAARYMDEVYNVSLNQDTEICHSIGSKSALALLPSCFINPGDITFVTVPGYPVLGTWTAYHGGRIVSLPLLKENNFFPDLSLITEKQKKEAKLLYINYPNNPTGASATREFFQSIVDFARENQIFIISDAAYAALNFSGKPLSILSIDHAKDVAVELHSMSKSFNMTGWRLGWVCGNPLVVQAFSHVKDNADSGQFAAIQKASETALNRHDRITSAIAKKYRRRLKKLTTILQSMGFDAEEPKGGFYLYIPIPKGIKNGKTFSTAEDFSQWLIKEKLICTVPWDDAGAYVRFSATFVAPGVQEEERVLNEIKNRLDDIPFVF